MEGLIFLVSAAPLVSWASGCPRLKNAILINFDIMLFASLGDLIFMISLVPLALPWPLADPGTKIKLLLNVHFRKLFIFAGFDFPS